MHLRFAIYYSVEEFSIIFTQSRSTTPVRFFYVYTLIPEADVHTGSNVFNPKRSIWEFSDPMPFSTLLKKVYCGRAHVSKWGMNHFVTDR